MKVLYLGEQSLQQPSQPIQTIDDSIRSLIADMFTVMKKDNGIGLAAPQVGHNIRLFIAKIDDGIEHIFINPHIIATSDRQCSYEEGCLSIPKIYASIIRPEAVTIQYQDIQGRRKIMEATGLLARVIQHESDHLDGILFIDHLEDQKKADIVNKFMHWQKQKAKRQLKKQKWAKI